MLVQRTLIIRGGVLLWCLLFSNVVGIFAQQRSNTPVLKLQDSTFSLPANAVAWVDSMRTVNLREPVQVLLQFYKLPSPEERTQWLHQGIKLYDYIPQLSYRAVITLPLKEISTDNIRSIIPVAAAWKITSALQASGRLQATANVEALVSFIPDTPPAMMLAAIAAAGGKMEQQQYQAYQSYTISIPGNRIAGLAAHPLVTAIGRAAKIEPLNKDSRSSSGAALLQAAIASGGRGLDGSGVTTGIGDNAHALVHVDARDRVINFNQAGISMHGVHTTLTVAGKGIMDPATKGMAPGASILNHFYELVWLQAAALHHSYNMTVTNNSYAAVINDCNNAGLYDQYARMLDENSIDNPEVLHVFAAGNDGLNTCNGYPESYATVNGGFQPAKNILVVGALDKNNIPWPKTSRGPVRDGRLKPDMVAYGYQVFSGDIWDNYGGSNGTSMSAPIVTGCMALLTQRYRQLYGNQQPPAALLKVLAMNGATDYGSPGPDFIYGYGLVNIGRSLDMLEQNRFIGGTAGQSTVQTHTIHVPAGMAALKVMLYWHDAPASVLAADALINDLDLEVVTPAGLVHLPLILDHQPSGVTQPAAEGADHKNNTEQVVLMLPQAGVYIIRVKGTLLPSGTQPYFISYDFIPEGVSLRFPHTDAVLASGDSSRIYWDASAHPNGFTLEWSADNGFVWHTISNNIPATQRHFQWFLPDPVSTHEALVRITRNGTAEQSVTGKFVLNPQPELQLAAIQCPGYIALEWDSVPQVTGYEILRKMGDDLRVTDTVMTTDHIIAGLTPDSTYYIAVRPLINGVPGYRSKAIRRKPADGDCSGGISDDDLRAAAITAPVTGRMHTTTALQATEDIAVLIENMDDEPVTVYRVSCQIDNNAWLSQVINNPLPPGGHATVTFAAQDLSAPGEYTITAAVENLAQQDPVKQNDTVMAVVRQLANAPVDIFAGFNDGFEDLPDITCYTPVTGVIPGNITSNRWDYTNDTDTGRLRSFVHQDITISGNRAVSLDLHTRLSGNQNWFTGTFHLGTFDTATTEARLEFDYKLHGKPKFEAGNEVWIRGADTDPWLPFFTFDTMAMPGQTVSSGSLSLTHALGAAGQQFSSSFQIRFGQHDTSCIAHNEYGNGMTLDNIRLYSVNNDVQLLQVLAPANFECSLTGSSAVQIRLYNSDNLPQQNINLYYRLDNGAVVSESLAFLAAKDTVDYTFQQLLPVMIAGEHILDVWLVAAGDSYLPNDSIMGYTIRNQPLMNTFPYLLDFEDNDGFWFTSGLNSSWVHGTLSGVVMNDAPSGSRVWHTGGNSGKYHDNEHSFLYSPCFDVSALHDPVLSFSLNTQLEQCDDIVCDMVYMEYAINGGAWTRLGAYGEGINWYNREGIQVWDEQENNRWRVASVSLPVAASLRLRFVLHTDPAVVKEGIAIDDIHIYDRRFPVYAGDNASLLLATDDTGWVDMIQDGAIAAQVYCTGSVEEIVSLDYYHHSRSYSSVVHGYHMPVSFVSKGTVDSRLRLFIADEAVLRMLNDYSCDTCAKAPDAYRLGIVLYSDPDVGRENGAWLDNENGSYHFIPHTAIQWVPYDKGYYGEATVSGSAELWLAAALPVRQPRNYSLYPNPVTDGRFCLLWSAAPGEKLMLTVTDVTGRTVHYMEVVADGYDHVSEIRLPQLARGIYLVRYRAGGYNGEKKIVVQE